MIFEILAGIAVLAFVILVIFTVRTLIRSAKMIDKINERLDNVLADLKLTQTEVNMLIGKFNAISEKIDDKIDDLDPMFCSINKVGSLCKDSLAALEFRHQSEEEEECKLKVANYVALADICLKIFKQFKRK